ncbi:Cadherin-like protein [Pseudocohnilembus persalinus]|uniref:Cadherin-like protein n=1 Tax=Pseudocohnilembus persalinus TaxID=266149 RepID=A0A0V0QL77_PSEPJ|nr:Cadherin-like protein [Pseudocohnilembus persalinus]|eukprot:KRX02982.1 Cadherin-like protein [Pseudocohnilembus persalinus]
MLPAYFRTNFNQNTIYLNTQNQPQARGKQYLVSYFSIQIPDSAFIGLYDPENNFYIDNLEKSKKIINQLYISQYIDSENYLTLKYNPKKIDNSASYKFILSENYSESLKDKIREIIDNQYYHEAIGEINIENSLLLEKNDADNQIEISSYTLKEIILNITISDNCLATFIPDLNINSVYFFTQNYKKITIIGKSIDLNKSLKKVRMDIDKDFDQFHCHGQIEIADQLNKNLNQTINLAQYFLINKAPYIKSEDLKLQAQYNLKFKNQKPLINNEYVFNFKSPFSDNDLQDLQNFRYEMEVYSQKNALLQSQKLIFFDQINMQFLITPQKEHINQIFTVFLRVSDQYKQNSDFFNLYIHDGPPLLKIPLQNQVQEAKFQENFSFQFDQNSFEDQENQPLSYQVVNLPGWLKFKPLERKFSGKPDSFEKIQITVIAEDPWGQKVEDTFVIQIQPSVFYYMSLFLTYFIPIVGFLSFLQYRDEIYALIFQKKYQFKRVIKVKVGQQLQMDLPLIREELQIAEKLMQIFHKNKNQTLRKQLLKEPELDKYGKYFYILKNQIKDKKLKNYLDEHTYQNTDKNTISTIFDGFINQYRMKNNKLAENIFEGLKKHCQNQLIVFENEYAISKNDWYQELLENYPLNSFEKNQQESNQDQESNINLEVQNQNINSRKSSYKNTKCVNNSKYKCITPIIQSQEEDFINPKSSNYQFFSKLKQQIESKQVGSDSNYKISQENLKKISNFTKKNPKINQNMISSIFSKFSGQSVNLQSIKSQQFFRSQNNTQNLQKQSYIQEQKQDLPTNKNRNNTIVSIDSKESPNSQNNNENLQPLPNQYQQYNQNKQNQNDTSILNIDQVPQNQVKNPQIALSINKQNIINKFPIIKLDKEKINLILDNLFILKKLNFKSYLKLLSLNQQQLNVNNLNLDQFLDLNKEQAPDQISTKKIIQSPSSQNQSQPQGQPQSQPQGQPQPYLNYLHKNKNQSQQFNFPFQNIDSTNNYNKNNNNKQFIYNLVYHNIRAEALGIEKYSVFTGSKGESLHINQSQLMGLRAVQKVNPKDTFLSYIKSKLAFFKLDYEKLSSSNVNKILPDWLIDSSQLGVLKISGVPTENDVGQFKLQILDKGQFILREIWIEVEKENFGTQNRKNIESNYQKQSEFGFGKKQQQQELYQQNNQQIYNNQNCNISCSQSFNEIDFKDSENFKYYHNLSYDDQNILNLLKIKQSIKNQVPSEFEHIPNIKKQSFQTYQDKMQIEV